MLHRRLEGRVVGPPLKAAVRKPSTDESQTGNARVRDFRLALAIAFERPWAYLVALGSAVGMAALLLWSSGLLVHYRTGWELLASPPELATMGVLSALFGLLVPLQIAALGRARGAVGTAGGIAGTVTGILSLSCCAPLLIPTLLSFVGFSGTTLARFNAAVSGLAVPLTIGSIALMLASIALVSHTITAACKLPAPRTDREASPTLAPRPPR